MSTTLRHDWQSDEVLEILKQPFSDLIFEAQSVHRQHFPPNQIQVSTLLSIKTGGCPEDCGYCPQSAHFDTGVKSGELMKPELVRAAAENAKQAGASRFCMGAAWRSPRDSELESVCDAIGEVKALGLETCATLGMLTADQAERLKAAGLDYYNHNIDTSAGFYKSIISTRTYDDRLETISHVQAAGMRVCCGGIVGMGESREDRAEMLRTLANLSRHPESVPINMLVQVAGTRLDGTTPMDPFEFVRTIAVARILMPNSFVRLSAGREGMCDELQALCFLAGANSIFSGEKLLTTPNADADDDEELLRRLGIKPIEMAASEVDTPSMTA
ncbi:MAG: biotin synthase BioB [Pirellulales bacterium]|nr:biotin synthase BioB [Pirellulales bacterium]